RSNLTALTLQRTQRSEIASSLVYCKRLSKHRLQQCSSPKRFSQGRMEVNFRVHDNVNSKVWDDSCM
ncbi:MAG: hypothetical protein ACRCYY_13875, partial [Trueperaceae bacterium]